MFASFGSASGGVESFNLALLAQKGSLFVTRPTVFTFVADRARLEKMARELFAVVASGKVKIPPPTEAALADAARVHAALEARQTTGTTVLLP
jgi:NADPH2:quinone reductase